MNRELLEERKAFKRKAMAVPVVENRAAAVKRDRDDGMSAKKRDKLRELGAQSQSAKAKLDLAHMKQMGGQSSAYKFGVLTKIVRHMKARHMSGEDQPLTLEEVLDETSQLDVTTKVRQWLQTEALINNPKISASQSRMTPEGPQYTFLFKPPFDISTRKGLLRLLEKHDRQGKGGIFYEDLMESLPRGEKIVNILLDQDRVIVLDRGADKKKVVFLKDISEKMQFDPDPEFKKLWRTVAVESMDDSKIEDYLSKTGFAFMQDQTQRKVIQRKPVKRKINRKKRAPRDNEHLKEILEDYDEMTAENNRVK